MSKLLADWFFLSLCVLWVGLSAHPALADGVATHYTYRLLLDTDNDPATGCGVAVDDATGGAITFPGVERLVAVTVARTAMTGSVTGITVQNCVSGATFGAAQSVSGGGWPVGKGDGVGGGDVIEGFAPTAALGNGGWARVAFTASRAVTGSDVLLSTTGALDGPPILFRLPFHAPVPLLSTTGLAMSVLLLGGVAWWVLRRRVSSQRAVLLALVVTAGGAATALALTIVMDGQVGDWGGVPPVATDPKGDSSLHDPNEDLVAGFLATDGTSLYFRMDVVAIALPIGYAVLQWPKTINQGITANYTTVYGQIYVPGLTDVGGGPGAIIAQLGFGPPGSDPASWAWRSMVFNVPIGNNYEYMCGIRADATGTYDYLVRFSDDGGLTWVYGDQDGCIPGVSSGTNMPGFMTITSSSDTTPPSAPVASIVSGAASLTVSWTAATDPDDAVAEYRVYRGTSPDGEGIAEIAIVSGSTLSYVDPQVNAGQTYYYKVKAFDTSLNPSLFSNEVSRGL